MNRGSQCWCDLPEDLIRRSLVVCGIISGNGNSELHQKLRDILQDESVTKEELTDEEHNGITDKTKKALLKMTKYTLCMHGC